MDNKVIGAIVAIGIIGAVLWLLLGDYRANWNKMYECENGVCRKAPGAYVAKD